MPSRSQRGVFTVDTSRGSQSSYMLLIRRRNEMALFSKKVTMPTRDQALAGRAQRMPVAAKHFVLGNPMTPPFPDGMQQALFGLGCFWGAEKKFWQAPGVYTTA